MKALLVLGCLLAVVVIIFLIMESMGVMDAPWNLGVGCEGGILK